MRRAHRAASRDAAMTPRAAPRLERIVIATDFGDAARVGAEWAVRSFAPEAEVLLVHALDLG
jgi:hypothetical protein